MNYISSFFLPNNEHYLCIIHIKQKYLYETKNGSNR